MFSACTRAVVSTPMREVVEGDVLDSFRGWLQRHDSRKSLRCERRPHAAFGLSDRIGVAHVAQVKFVQRRCAEGHGCVRLASCARPLDVASNPGTLAPPVPVG